MIGYITLGTNDLPRAAAFYDALLGSIGARRVMEYETFVLWGNGAGKAGLGVIKPYDKKAATHGNGTMVALAADSAAQVDALYKKALELGATCEGPAGQRAPGFYAAYFRDLDGNKLNVFYTGS